MLLFAILGDELPEAGTKFKIGDFVTVKRTDERVVKSWLEKVAKDEIFIVYNTPKTNDPKRYFENRYCLTTIDKEGTINPYWEEFFECHLEKYNGEVAEPYKLLSKVYKEEIKLSDETWNKICEGEILLNLVPSWKEIPELSKQMKSQKSQFF